MNRCDAPRLSIIRSLRRPESRSSIHFRRSHGRLVLLDRVLGFGVAFDRVFLSNDRLLGRTRRPPKGRAAFIVSTERAPPPPLNDARVARETKEKHHRRNPHET